MSEDLVKYQRAVGPKSVDGRKYAEVAYAEFVAALAQVRGDLAKIDVIYQITAKGAGLSLTTPFGAITAEKEYFLDGDQVAIALVFTDESKSDALPGQVLGALYLTLNNPWSMSTGESFTADFATEKYPDWVATRVVLAVMAAKLALSTKRCLALKSNTAKVVLGVAGTN